MSSNQWNFSPASTFLKQVKRAVTIANEADYLRATVQLHGRGIVIRDRVSGSRIKTKKQFLVSEGDFLVAEIDAKVGGFGIVPASLQGAIVSSHYFTFEIDNDVMVTDFLASLIKVGRITEAIQGFVKGSLNYASIRPQNVLAMMLPVPPLSTQRRIVDAVASANAIGAAARQQLRLAESLPHSILTAALNGAFDA